MAAKKARKTGTEVIYTAHGFHFYKGAPLHYWLMSYPVEKYLAKYTDTLITINQEDYNRAKRKFSRRCKDIEYVPGVGLDQTKFSKRISSTDKAKLRQTLNLKKNDFVISYIGRLDKNKNQGMLISVMPGLLDQKKNCHLLLIGADELHGKYQRQVRRLGIENDVHFLGFRKDISEILQISDLLVSTSKREGLPVSVMEAMQLKVPIIATDCRGNRDLVQSKSLVPLNSRTALQKALVYATKHESSLRSAPKLESKYLIDSVYKRMVGIYQEYLQAERADGHKISIIIPVYNAEKFIGKCLDSIIEQVRDANLELIIVNDGSTDNSRNICNSYAKKYSFVKLYIQANRGVSAARNNGLRKATGDYIYFVDADDKLLPNAIANVQQALQFDPDIIASDFVHFSDNNNQKPYNSGTTLAMIDVIYNPEDLLGRKKYNLSLSANVIRKDILTKNKLFLDEQVQHTEDLDYMLSALLLSKKIAILSDPIYGYRQNNQSATAKISQKTVTDITNFVNKWDQYVGSAGNHDLQAGIGNFLAYETLIASGMASLLKYNNPGKILKEHSNLFKYRHGAKVRLGFVCYKIFGAKITAILMGKYLKFKGLKC